MNDARFQELMEKRLDGALSRDEQRELEALITADSSRREEHDHVLRTVALFEEAQEVEPPDDLTDSIMDEIERSAAPVSRGTLEGAGRFAAWFAGLREIFTAPRLAFGVVTAAVAVAIVLNVGYFSGHVADSEMSGAITPGQQGMTTVSTARLSLGEAVGRATVVAGDGRVVVSVDMSADIDSPVRIEYDPSDLVFAGVTGGDGSALEFSDTQGQIVLERPNSKRLILTFKNISRRVTPINFSFATQGGVYVLSTGPAAN